MRRLERRDRGTLLPYVAPIADRLGALQAYVGSIAHGAGADALVKFPGGVAFTVAAMLEAPVEVAAKSSHSTRAAMRTGEEAAMLRFVLPACAVGREQATGPLLSKFRNPLHLSHVK